MESKKSLFSDVKPESLEPNKETKIAEGIYITRISHSSKSDKTSNYQKGSDTFDDGPMKTTPDTISSSNTVNKPKDKTKINKMNMMIDEDGSLDEEEDDDDNNNNNNNNNNCNEKNNQNDVNFVSSDTNSDFEKKMKKVASLNPNILNEMNELKLQVFHLERSNKEIDEFDPKKQDPELQLAIQENIVIIAKKKTRLNMLIDQIKKIS